MFGMLRPLGLHGEAKESYKASFCGSCHAMASVDRLSSLATSYDITFLSHVLGKLAKAPVLSLPCTVRKSRMLSVRKLEPNSQRWLAAVNFLLMGAKCQDDVLDEGGWKGRVGLGLLSKKLKWARKVALDVEFDDSSILHLPHYQAAMEKHPSPSLEELALPTSLMLGDVFAHVASLSARPELRGPLAQLGQALGAAIYVKDACNDFKADRKKRRFNALWASGLSSEHEPDVQRFLGRELYRARTSLCHLGLGGKDAPLPLILESLGPGLLEAAASSCSRFSFCRPIGAKCDGCCDCSGGCDCGSCDCNVCGCDGGADACGGCRDSCSSCSDCDGCHLPSCDGCHLPSCDLAGCFHGCGDLGKIDICTSCDCDCCDCGDCCDVCGAAKAKVDEVSAAEAGAAVVATGAAAAAVSAAPKETLLCPACSRKMDPLLVSNIEIDECRACYGLWFDHKELGQILASGKIPSRLLSKKAAASSIRLRPEGTRPCPRCSKVLDTSVIEGVTVDLCHDCKGLFLDSGELNQFLDPLPEH